MIRQIFPKDNYIIRSFLEKDIGRNYFILLGLTSKKEVFDKIYGQYDNGELKAVLFRRNSGVLQFFGPGEFDVDGFANLISTMEYHKLIGPKSYCDKFLGKGVFASVADGAYIAKLDKECRIKTKENKYITRHIKIEDLDEIVSLYREVFTGFTPKEVMAEKLSTNRGRGVCIEKNGEIISVAQTDFETRDGALIVGVATKNNYRNKGLASACIEVLIESMQEQGKDIFLQYDNLEAGRIYERLGFKRIDQVMHYNR